MIKSTLESHVAAAIDAVCRDIGVPEGFQATPLLERTRDRNHGEFASGVAMRLAGRLGKAPRAIAGQLIEFIQVADAGKLIERLEIAGPGFINFFLRQGVSSQVVATILDQGNQFGQATLETPIKVHLEFVSANPTGPLHVGHGRGAAYGASLANLLRLAGYDVFCEYYVNDAGRQMDILAVSVWLRYLQLNGASFNFPVNGYKGDYVNDIARQLLNKAGTDLCVAVDRLFADLPPDEPAGGDKELHVDALILRARQLLGLDRYRLVFDSGVQTILADIRNDLEEFGVTYDRWYSEASLVETQELERALDVLNKAGFLYEQKGALWFKSTEFGDEKDRVVRRENGLYTYFASDIAYHLEKVTRGFDQLIDIWGADHHGYIPRVKGALQACGINPDLLQVLLVQFAILYRGTERVQMSTRSGEFVTLRELRAEVGNDAARFFYVMRKSEQHLDFDLELAKKQSNDNPVYYIQYAHARVNRILRRIDEQSLSYNQEEGLANLELLINAAEQTVIEKLAAYPETIERAARSYEPHQICGYLKDLATAFHAFYQQKEESARVLHPDSRYRNSRVALCLAVRQVLSSGLAVVGVSAPEEM